MKAARYSAKTKKLELTEVPVPEPGPREVVVKVQACGICLSDVHLIDGSLAPVAEEVTVGHESAGVIAEVGSDVRGWARGDRVALTGGKPCEVCERCRTGNLDRCLNFKLMGFHYDGAWAEYVRVPFYSLTPVPAHVPIEQAAILADAVATPYAALTDRAAVKPGESVGLWGIGGLGTHAVQIAKLIGAAPIVAVDPLASARRRALMAGADVAIDPNEEDVNDAVKQATGGLGLDVAVDLVGANAVLKQAVTCLGMRGRAVMVGLSLERIELGPGVLLGVMSQSVLGHLGYQKHHLDQLMTLLSAGRLDLAASITDEYPLDDVHEGVGRLATKEGDPVRLVVKP